MRGEKRIEAPYGVMGSGASIAMSSCTVAHSREGPPLMEDERELEPFSRVRLRVKLRRTRRGSIVHNTSEGGEASDPLINGVHRVL
jgi:hypothetical protein